MRLKNDSCKDTRKITVLHIRDSGGIHGAERVILALARYLDKFKFNFVLLCLRGNDGSGVELIEKAKALGIFTLEAQVNARFDLKALKRIRRLIKQVAPSIIHTHDYKSDFYALFSSLRLCTKLVTTAHGSTRDAVLLRFYLLLDKFLIYPFFSKIICVSNQLARQYSRLLPLHSKIVVIQNGIDLSFTDQISSNSYPLPLPSIHANGKIFGIIGRLFPDKGHFFFLKAFANLCLDFPNALALIVGDGPLKQTLSEQIRSLRLENNVIMCGPRPDIHNIYNQIDFLVIPSLTEGLPYVLLEAMTAQVPVLASAVGDIPLLIRHGETGYLVPPRNVKILETYMRALLDNQIKAKKMASNAYTLATRHYTAQNMAKNTEMLYESLV